MKRKRRAAIYCAVLAALCVPGTTAQEDMRQYEAKAKFLAIAPGFVEWPETTFKTAGAPLQMCVHGDFSFGTKLAELTRSATVKGHRIDVKWAHKEEELPACQIVFVSRSAAKRYDKVVEAVKDSIALTVGEDTDFFQAGGMLSLQSERTSLLFDVNLDAVNNGHLKLSSQLLSLARHIVHRTESAKK